MTGRWKVTKRDGVWCAIDDEGDLRHAAADWRSAHTFALMGADKTGWHTISRNLIADIIRARYLRRLWFGDNNQ